MDAAAGSSGVELRRVDARDGAEWSSSWEQAKEAMAHARREGSAPEECVAVGRRRNFASCLAGDAKWVPCLGRLLEHGFDTQMYCAEPILGIGRPLGHLLESV